ncbi:hypothetical protein NQ113_24640 [Bacillus pseudomycoides]|uniref:hypothetical protein n=1 Tax=Bacillus pseudomycoides TaxID=64104 RepID=UPI00215AFB62|nr:hypothetical protein [Bacillus pseudomycoides]MCR8860362.1 hypothetical protein [Bacillus pseudomycoides]
MKEIFSRNKNIDKNAYLNFRTYDSNGPNDSITSIHNMNVIAEGFRDAALSLVKGLLSNNPNSGADNLIFPILFNTNHSIEVYLKAICWTQNLLLNKSDKFDITHDLRELFAQVVDLETELRTPGDNLEFYTMLNGLDAYIDELYGKIERTFIDKKGNEKIRHDIEFCRYALSNDSKSQFYINALDNVVVDLENFLAIFEQIFKNLDSLLTHYIQLYLDKPEFQA